MSTHYIPPKSENEVKIEKIKEQLREALRPHIKKKSLEDAIQSVMILVKPLVATKNQAELGATVMTKNAAKRDEETRDFKSKPKNY